MSERIAFWKGHGTENDFVLLPDRDGTVLGDLSPGLTAALCDRRAGLGADGVLRVVRTEAYDDPAAVAARGEAEWFMDYRNADGSVSEMCGNGIRVFARHLVEEGLVSAEGPIPIGTRADAIKDRLVVLSVADLLGEAIHRIHHNESVSALFKKDGKSGMKG